MPLLIKHTLNIADKSFHLHHHHRIKNSECSLTNFSTNQNFENTYTANNIYTANNTANINEARENNSDAESCVSTENEVSKAKQDRWNTQQMGVLVNMWKDHYKEWESSKQHSI